MSDYVLSKEEQESLARMERATADAEAAEEARLKAMTPEEKQKYLEDALHMSLKMESSIPMKDP
jgi:hypothetical protein